jgi:hypothetical protein
MTVNLRDDLKVKASLLPSAGQCVLDTFRSGRDDTAGV